MICKSCKREITDNSIFCSWCGVKQIKTPAELGVPAPRQLKSGSWNIQLRKENRSVTKSTAEACTLEALAIRLEYEKQSACAPSITVSEAVNSYIKDREGVLSPATIKAYKSVAKYRFVPEMPLMINTDINWQSAVSREAREVSAKTVKNAWGLISAALTYHKAEVPVVALPMVPVNDLPWLDYEQIPVFCEAIKGKPFELAALLALHSLRRSEIYGLKLSDFDLKKNIIKVRGSAVYDSENRMVFKDTAKSAKAVRDVPILIPRLKELVQSGASIDYAGADLYKMINRLCREVGLPGVGVHGLRRSFASLAYHLGWSERETMRCGGWSSADVMHKFYIKLASSDKTASIDKMQKFYKKQVK